MWHRTGSTKGASISRKLHPCQNDGSNYNGDEVRDDIESLMASDDLQRDLSSSGFKGLPGKRTLRLLLAGCAAAAAATLGGLWLLGHPKFEQGKKHDDVFGLRSHPLQVVDTTIPRKSRVIDTAVVDEATHVPKVFHFVWLSTDWENEQPLAPSRVLRRIDSWKRLHPNWSVVVWTNALIQQHFPTLYKSLSKIQTASWASNLVRYHVLASFGGVYLDTDIEPLRPLQSKLLISPFTVCERPRDGGQCKLACNAVIASPRGNTEIREVASEALRRTQDHIQKNPNGWYNVSLTGPTFWSETSISPGTSFQVLPARTFFPCDWKDRSACIADLYVNDTDVYAMHVWEKSWGSWDD